MRLISACSAASPPADRASAGPGDAGQQAKAIDRGARPGIDIHVMQRVTEGISQQVLGVLRAPHALAWRDLAVGRQTVSAGLPRGDEERMGTHGVVIGRERELTSLTAFLIARDGGALVLQGEAGIGKSVLLDVVSRQATGPPDVS
ncbi:hypothetical protein [Streptomyces sp. NPDC101165]|uniref:hypothetical protein n=1 Tax=Streptomyces sp. NPDC101165 TaxID=3366119 RepID=UPI0038082804